MGMKHEPFSSDGSLVESSQVDFEIAVGFLLVEVKCMAVSLALKISP